MKYIILEVGDTELPFIFPEVVQHKDMADTFNHKVVSAGFLQLDSRGKLECVGKSEGLSIFSRPKDVEIIKLELEPFAFVLNQRGL